MRLESIDTVARRQFGVIHRSQTPLSPDAWRRAIAAGTFIGLHPDVARCVGAVPGELQRIRAATLAVDDAVASHRSAAVLWGFVEPDDEPDDHAAVHVIGVERHAQRRALIGVTCHRPDDRLDVRAVHRHGIPATPPLRTLLDLGITDPHRVMDAVGVALSTGLLTVNGLEAGLRRHARPGRTGVRALRVAIDDWAIDARPADSVLEQAFTELCERHHLPPVSFHERIAGWEVDFRFVGTPVVVECDGWTTHGRDRHQFEVDRRKDDDLRAAGWIPARVTYRAVTQRGADTAHRLTRLLDRWGDAPCPDRRAA